MKDLDKPVCVEISMERGYCTTIISGKGFYVSEEEPWNGQTWFMMRPTHIRVPKETWAALKKYFIDNCKRTQACNVNIDSWNRAIKNIDEQVEKENKTLINTSTNITVNHLEVTHEN